MTTEEFHALWRSSAHEAVPYTDDFPEALLVLPELSDGSIGQGNSTRVTIKIDLNKENSRLTVTDNGGGIRNERRLLQWAAQKASDNIHRNGHGTKKCLTKWEPDYTKASWTIKWRIAGKNLQVAQGPFKGRDTLVEEIENDQVTLMPSGCEISIGFTADNVLGPLSSKPEDLYAAIKEIIQTRYSEEVLNKTDFVISISSDAAELDKKKKMVSHSSHKEKWHSFKKRLEDSVKDGVAVKLHESRYDIVGGYYTIEVFFITMDGNKSFAVKKEFPIYGRKSMKSSRVHIALDGRTIEPIHLYQLLGLEANHNDYNGYKVFVNFVPNSKDCYDKLPVPCTTKVSLYKNDPIYQAFVCNFVKVFQPVHRKNFKEEAEKPKGRASAPTGISNTLVAPKIVPTNDIVSALNDIVRNQPKVAPTPAASPVVAIAPTATPVVAIAPAATPVVAIAPAATPVVSVAPTATPVVAIAPAATPVVSVAPAANPSATSPVVAIAPPATTTPTAISQMRAASVPPATIPVSGHNKLSPCSKRNLYESLLHFKDELNALPLETLCKASSTTAEPGLSQKLLMLHELLEAIRADITSKVK